MTNLKVLGSVGGLLSGKEVGIPNSLTRTEGKATAHQKGGLATPMMVTKRQ